MTASGSPLVWSTTNGWRHSANERTAPARPHNTFAVRLLNANTPLSLFTVVYQPNRQYFRSVTDPHRFETQYRSPQLELWGPGTVEWHFVRRVSNYARRH